MEISLVPVYIVNGENHSAFYWFDICCPLSFCLFVLFAWFVFHFSASSQWYFACFHSILILIRFSFEHFPKQFSLAVDQICIMHTHACVQNPITTKYFVFIFETKNWNAFLKIKLEYLNGVKTGFVYHVHSKHHPLMPHCWYQQIPNWTGVMNCKLTHTAV